MIETIESLNERLKDIHGTNVVGKAKFRLVWSNDQREKRLSDYNDFYSKNILIRRVHEVREVPKYPSFKDRYILETLSNPISDEIKNHNGYEPLFVFQKNDETPIDPVWWAIEYIISRVGISVKPLSEEEILAEEQKSDDKEYERIMAMLEGDKSV